MFMLRRFNNIGKKFVPFKLRTPLNNFVILLYLEITIKVPKIRNKKSNFAVTINQENYNQLVGHEPIKSKGNIYTNVVKVLNSTQKFTLGRFNNKNF